MEMEGVGNTIGETRLFLKLTDKPKVYLSSSGLKGDIACLPECITKSNKSGGGVVG